MKYMAWLVGLAFFSGVTVAESSFTAKPAVTRDGDKVKIAFTVSAPTDVEVAVVDSTDKVVRHLAAGLLGGAAPPPPPLVAGLAQQMDWDGLDDYGKKLAAGPCKVRVRLGVRPVFEKAVSIKVFNEKSVKYGPGGLDSSGDLIDMGHPIWKNGSKQHSPDPAKFMFYAGTTRIDMVVSDETDEIILQCWASGPLGQWKDVPIARFDGLTGKFIAIFPLDRAAYGGKLGAHGHGEPVMDWFGRYVLHEHGAGGWQVSRLTLEGKPFNFVDGANVFSQPERFRTYVHQRGMAIGPDGNLYIAQVPLRDEQDPVLAQSNFVSKFDENGKLLKDALVQVYAPICQGVNVDLKGNIFVGVGVKLQGKPVPDEIASKVAGDFEDACSQACWAKALYGSIVKFGPDGGSILPDANGGLESCGYNNAKQTRVGGKGLKWIHYGASFQPTHNGKMNQRCFCFTPRFDVDRFGRVLFPNPFQNEFKALDNEGNLLFRVHNRDIASAAKVGLGTTVQATDHGIYVADHPNNQILIFRWKAQAETLMDAP